MEENTLKHMSTAIEMVGARTGIHQNAGICCAGVGSNRSGNLHPDCGMCTLENFRRFVRLELVAGLSAVKIREGGQCEQ